MLSWDFRGSNTQSWSRTSTSVIPDAVAGLTRAAKPAWAYAYAGSRCETQYRLPSYIKAEITSISKTFVHFRTRGASENEAVVRRDGQDEAGAYVYMEVVGWFSQLSNVQYLAQLPLKHA